MFNLFGSLFDLLSLSYFSEKAIGEHLTLKPNFSLRIDLARVSSSPWAFERSVLIVEGFVVIQEIWDLEHFDFGSSSLFEFFI